MKNTYENKSHAIIKRFWGDKMTKDEIIKKLEKENLQLAEENKKLKKFIQNIKSSLE